MLLAGSLSALVLAISEGPDWGWTSPAVLVSGALAVVLMAAFVLRSARHAEPVLDLTLFRSRSFSVANLATLLYAMGFFAMLLGNILFLTSVWGYSILLAGLAVTPGPLVVAVVAGPAGKLAGRIGFRPVLLVGFVVFASGLAWYALRVGVDRDYLGGVAAREPHRRARDRPHLPRPQCRRRLQPAGPSGSRWAAPSTRPPARSAARSGWPCSSSCSARPPPRPPPWPRSTTSGGSRRPWRCRPARLSAVAAIPRGRPGPEAVVPTEAPWRGAAGACRPGAGADGDRRRPVAVLGDDHPSEPA